MSAIYEMPGHLIRRLQQISTSVFSERMKGLGIDLTSPQHAALMLLSEHPGIDQATLAGAIALDRPTIGGVVDRLVSKGYVERRTKASDRRARALSLTRSGKRLLTRMQPLVCNVQDDMLPGLSETEKRHFISLAAKVVKAGNDRSRAPLVPPRSSAA